MKKNLFIRFGLVLALVFYFLPGFATHIIGGEITYKYLRKAGGRYWYAIDVKIYVDAASNIRFSTGQIGNNPALVIYNGTTLQIDSTIFLEPDPNDRRNRRQDTIQVGNNCNIANLPCLNGISIYLNHFQDTISRPFNLDGWYLYFTTGNRNSNLNLANATNTGTTFISKLPGALYYNNSSPQFTDKAIPFMLTHELTSFVNTAYDPDGDRLVYNFVQPWDGTANNNGPSTFSYPNLINFNPGYSVTQQMGVNGISRINSITGLTEYYTNTVGRYVLTIEISEYRTLPNGVEVLLGKTRRELQMLVRSQVAIPGDPTPPCPPNSPPVFYGSAQGTPPDSTVYRVFEGQNVAFTIGIADSNVNDLDSLKAEGDIISGTGGYSGRRAQFSVNPGQAQATGNFSWTPPCGTGGSSYQVIIRGTDNGCPGKTTSLVYIFNVLKFKAFKTSTTAGKPITGDTATCSQVPIHIYKIGQLYANVVSKQWKVTGGTVLLTYPNSDSVKIKWTAPNGNIWFVATSRTGCKDSTRLTVTNFTPPSLLTVSPDVSICKGDSAKLTVSGGGSGVYQWAPTLGLTDPNASTIWVKPTATTQYIVSSRQQTGCILTDTVVVTVIQNPKFNFQPVKACVSIINQPVGFVGTFGFTYKWIGDTTGLSSSTISNPTLSLTNTGATDLKRIYILQTTRNLVPCVSYDTLKVNIAALPVANLGPDDTVCSGERRAIFPSTLSPNCTYTYDNPANLTFNGDTAFLKQLNNGNTPLTTSVRVTVVNQLTGCSIQDTINLTVAPILDASIKDTSTCRVSSLNIGPIKAKPGYIYTWSPKLYLDDSTKANPVFNYPPSAPTGKTSVQYLLKVSNATGTCMAQRTVTVNLTDTPKPFAGNDTTFCSNDSTLIYANPADARYTYKWSPGKGLSDSTIARPRIYINNASLNNSSRTYILTLTDKITGCKATDTVVFTIKPQTRVDAGKDTALCDNNTVTIGSPGLAGYTYNWNKAANLDNANISNPVYTTHILPGLIPKYDTLVLHATNLATLCTYRDTVVVTSLPFPVVTARDTATCSNTPAIINGGNIKQYKYKWSPGTFLSDSTSNKPIFKGINNGTAPVTYTYHLTLTAVSTTGAACVASKDINITLYPQPTSDAGPSQDVCPNTPFTLGLPPQPGLAYKWDTTEGITLANQNLPQPLVSVKNPGQTILRKPFVLNTIQVATGCSKADTVYINILPSPVALAGSRDSVCANDSAIIGTPALAGFSYKWKPALGLNNDTLSNPKVALANAGASVITQIYTRTTKNLATGCLRTDTLKLRVNPLPVPFTGSNKAVCTGSSARVGGLADPNYSYKWFALGNAWLPGITGKIAADTASETDVILKNSTGLAISQGIVLRKTSLKTGCSNKDTVYLTVNPLPASLAGNDTVVCPNSLFSIGAPRRNGFTYAWESGPGIDANNQNNSSVSLALPNTGVGIVKLCYVLNTTETATGCSNTDTVCVSVNPYPLPQTGTLDSLCSGDSITIGTPAQGGMFYKWYPSFGLNNDTLAQPKVSVINAGTTPIKAVYKLTLTNRLTKCSKTDSITLRVNPLPDHAAVNRNTSVCSGVPVSFNAQNVGGYKYKWLVPGGTYVNGISGIIDNDSLPDTRFSLTSTNSSPTLQLLWLKTTSLKTGCVRMDTFIITVNPLPLANAYSGDTLRLCSGTTDSIGTTALPGFTYSWSFNGSLYASGPRAAVTLTSNTPVVKKYVLTVTGNTTGCSNSDTAYVRVRVLPTVFKGPNDSLCSGGSVVLGVPTRPNGNTYQWTPTTGLDLPNSSSPTLTLVNPTQTVQVIYYKLKVTDRFGCINTDSIAVRVNPLPVVKAKNDTSVCTGDSVSISDVARISGSTYQLTPIGGFGSGISAAINNSANHGFRVLLTNSTQAAVVQGFAYQITSKSGCVKTDSIYFTINPLPLAQAALTDTLVICSKTGVQLGTSAMPANGYRYKWTTPSLMGSLSSDTVPTPTYTGSNTGTNPIFVQWNLLVSNKLTGCSKLAKVIVKVNPLPFIVDTGTVNSLCSGDTILLGAVARAGIRYSWSPASAVINPNILNSYFTATVPNGSPSKLVKLALTATDPIGCQRIDTVHIRVNARPVANAGGATRSICSGQSIPLGVNQSGQYNYAWRSRFATFSANTVANPTVTATNTGTTDKRDTLVVTVTDKITFCKSTDTTFLTVHPLPVYDTISAGSQTVCPYVQGVRYSVRFASGQTWNWRINPANAGTITAGNGSNAITIDWNGPGQASVLVTPQFVGTGCKGPTDSLVINKTQQLDPKKPTGDTLFCAGGGRKARYTTGYTNNSVYTWYYRQPGSTTDVLVPGDSSVSIEWIGTGTGQVWVRENSNTASGTSTYACEGYSLKTNVTIWPSPSDALAIQGPTSICAASGPVKYTLPSLMPGSHYKWVLDSAGISRRIAKADSSIILSFVTSGTYKLRVTETTSRNCVGNEISQTIQINSIPTTTLGAFNKYVCATRAGRAILYSVNNPNGARFKWTVNNAISADTNATSDAITVVWKADSTPVLKVQETSSFGCSGTVVNFNLIADHSTLEFVSASYPEGDSTTVDLNYTLYNSLLTNRIVAQRGLSVSQLQTAASTSVPSSQIALSALKLSQGPEYYRLILLNNCNDTLPVPIHRTVGLQASVTDAGKGTSLAWTAYEGWPDGVGKYVIYRKVTGSGWTAYDSVAANVFTFHAVNGGDGFNHSYQIKAVRANGKASSFSNPVIISFENKVEVSNVLTPNGDHRNDYFHLENAQLYTRNQLIVFNRWGQTVFEADDYKNDWQGDNLPAGTYYFLFKTYLPTESSFRGEITIIK